MARWYGVLHYAALLALTLGVTIAVVYCVAEAATAARAAIGALP